MNKNQKKSSKMFWRMTLLPFLILMGVGAVHGKDFQPRKVYMFGFATSFNDSTVYFTDIQTVNDAWVYDKQRTFLVNRDDYSYQLRDYLKQQGLDSPTCVTIFAFDEKEIRKKYETLHQRYEGKKRKFDFLVRNVPATVFSYHGVEPSVGTVLINPEKAEAAAQKTERAEAKAKRKALKKAHKVEKGRMKESTERK